MRKLLPSILVAGLVAAPLYGCPIFIVPDEPGPITTAGRAPIIHSFDYSPKTGVGKNDAIVFTVVATDPGQQVLSYTWSSTKGTLSSTTGQSVSWRPTKADGSFEPGLTSVTVLVNNGIQVSVGTVNIQINEQGEAVVQDVVMPTPAPAASTEPASTSTPAPTVAPSTAPSAEPTAEPTPEAPPAPSHVYFEDGFEGGLENWNVGSYYLGGNWNPLSWKTALSGAQEGRVAAILNDGDDEVKPNADQPEIWITSKTPIDLTEAKLPRVKLYVKNGATPPESVTFEVVLSKDLDFRYNLSEVFKSSPFNGGKDWTAKDIDLSLAKGKVAYVGVVLRVKNNNLKFSGPMVDNVVVYDAGK